MIIARAPLRVALAGGGTDQPWYANKFGAHFVSASIDKYVHVILNKRWDKKIRVAYSKDEVVSDASELKHPLLRVLLHGRSGIELHSIADVPTNTGLGSSGAFSVAVIAALQAFDGENPGGEMLARMAFDTESEIDPFTGWHDHWVSALGGVREYWGDAIQPRAWDQTEVKGLEDLHMWFTGWTHRATQVLQSQTDHQNFQAMHHIKALVKRLVLHSDHVGTILNEHQQLKEATSDVIVPEDMKPVLRDLRELGTELKLVGAGGGGFLLLTYKTKDYERIKDIEQRMLDAGMWEMPVKFGVPGVQITRW